MKKFANVKLVVLTVLLSFFIMMPVAYGVDFNIIQLTTDNINDRNPNVYFNGTEIEITWESYYAGISDFVIKYYYLHLPTMSDAFTLFGQSTGNYSPSVNYGYVVWRTGNDEILLRDVIGGVTYYMEDGSEPFFDGSTISFADGIYPRNIYFTDGADTTMISTNSYRNVTPSHHGSLYAWSGDGDNSGTATNWIYYKDGASAPQYIKNYGSNFQEDSFYPSVHNGKIAWSKKANSLSTGSDIYLWNGGTNYNFTRITNRPDKDDIKPSLYYDTIAWQGIDPTGTDYEIFYFDGTTIQQVTDNDFDDVNPSLYNGVIAWQKAGSFGEIFYAIPEP